MLNFGFLAANKQGQTIQVSEKMIVVYAVTTVIIKLLNAGIFVRQEFCLKAEC